jgi:uncharacterized protein YdcH (DUF465 family)
MADVVEKRTFDEVELGKRIAETDVLADQARARHQDALGSNYDAQKGVIQTEAETQEHRMQFQRLLSTSNCLNDRIDIAECERARLNETVQKLEQERVILLSNNDKYDAIAFDLQNQIK